MTRRTQSSDAPLTAEAHLRRLLSGSQSRTYQWHHVLAIAEAVTAKRTSRRETLLRRAALYEGTFRLDPSHGMPHAMPPEDVLRCIAVQALGKWDPRKHRDVILRVADVAEREMVAEIAWAALAR
jgi:hypothetical protein